MDYNHPIYEIKQPLPEQGFMEGLNPDEIEAVCEYLRNEVVVEYGKVDGEPLPRFHKPLLIQDQMPRNYQLVHLVRDRVNADNERQTIVVWQPHVWACYTEVNDDAPMRAHTIKFSDYFKLRYEHRGKHMKKYGV